MTFLRILITEGRGVRLCWDLSRPERPKGRSRLHNSKHIPRNTKHETRNTRHETRDTKSATRSLKPQNRNRNKRADSNKMPGETGMLRDKRRGDDRWGEGSGGEERREATESCSEDSSLSSFSFVGPAFHRVRCRKRRPKGGNCEGPVSVS